MTAQRGHFEREAVGEWRERYARHKESAEFIAREIVGAEPARWCVGLIAGALLGVDQDAEARGRVEELDEVIAWLKASGRADAEALTLLRARAENHR